jgi:hypothetical protein
VIAYAATAVPSTGRRPPVYEQGSAASLVSSTRRDDQALWDQIVEGQYAALDRLEAKDFAGTHLCVAVTVSSLPRRSIRPPSTSGPGRTGRAHDEIKAHRPAFMPCRRNLEPEPGTRHRMIVNRWKSRRP